MDLPLLLCGPILRRVEPTLVTVWVALRDPASVAIRLWEGLVSSGAGNMLISSEPQGTPTLRVGPRLHVVAATLKIPLTSPRVLQPGKNYSYDLVITTDAGTQTLKTLDLLTTGQVFGKAMEPLGFTENMLPSFAVPPAAITDLRVLFGSCRRPYTDFPDAMVWIDDLMRENAQYAFTDPLKRPHQLFLGGDQIYADDVSPVHLRVLIDLSMALMGTQPGGAAAERLLVDNIRHKKPDVSAPASFADYQASVGRTEPTTALFWLPADHSRFGAGRRFLLTVAEAQMTTVDGWAHLFALGEFAAMYLSVWSDACWPRTNGLPPALALPSPAQLMTTPTPWPDTIATFVDAPLGGKEGRDFDLPENERKLSPFQNYHVYREPRLNDKRTDAQKENDYTEHLNELIAQLDGHRQNLTVFEAGLGKVRRALANIPTYMLFDDHDVTDDWNLNPMWLDRVYHTSLGPTMVRNALVAYALFQDWGNDPVRYESGPHKDLLDQIAAMFPPDATKGPNETVANNLDALFGFGLRGITDPIDGSVSAVSPPITWHFSVPGPTHLAVALDNRTRRSFVSRNGPPGNVAGSLERTARTVQTEQIPAGPFSDGKEVLFVIAPLQVLGPPLLDELVAPAAFRAFDIKDYTKKLQPGLRIGSRGMAGTNPDAIEAWAFDPKTLEALLRRLEPYRQVVLLSGDVHYSASTVMSYWTKNVADPARLVQFTSSGFKNVMPSYITAVDRSMSLAHKIVRAKVGAERLGWDVKPSNPILLPEGATRKDIPRALRGRLRFEPTLLPTYGWPAGSTINPVQRPDWSWRVDPIFDVRPDAQRPPAIRALDIEVDAEAMLSEINAPRALEGYQAVSARHQHALETLRNSRQILFRSAFGLVRFERRGNVLHAIHEMYTAARVPEDTGTAPPTPELFVLHETALAAPAEVRPELLSLQPIPADAPRVVTA